MPEEALGETTNQQRDVARDLFGKGRPGLGMGPVPSAPPQGTPSQALTQMPASTQGAITQTGAPLTTQQEEELMRRAMEWTESQGGDLAVPFPAAAPDERAGAQAQREVRKDRKEPICSEKSMF